MKKRILIAEDESVYADAMNLKLRKAGYDVTSVTNGEDVLDALKHGTFDLLLLDILMPRMDGFQVLKELRMTNAKIAVIVISKLNKYSDVQMAISLGASEFLNKTDISLADLVARINNHLNQ